MGSQYDHAIAGALSGITARAICQPFDVIKIRFQVQEEPIKATKVSYYQGITQATRRILAEEGISGLWKGHVPAQLLSVIYGAVNFSVFEYTIKYVHFKSEIGTDLLAGGWAGVVSTVVCLPMDTLRTRIISQGKKKVYHGLMDAVLKLWSVSGPLGFFRGLTPACLHIFPQNALQFALYRFLRVQDSGEKDPSNLSQLRNLSAGGIAGLVSKASVYPLDLAKKRLQIHNFEEARRPFGAYHSTRHLSQCLVRIVQFEGLQALYKGFFVSALKSSVATAIIFPTNDLLFKYLNMRH